MPKTEPGRAAAAWNEIRVLETAKGPIEVAVAGTGPAVLVIHGMPGSWRQCFSLAEDLADAYTIVAPSRPGYGRTPLSVGRTYAEQADAHAAVLDALDLPRAALVGASGGGPSAVAFAERHASRCDALVLACALVPHMVRVPPVLRFVTTTPGLGEAFSALSRAGARRQLGSAKAIDKALAKGLSPEEAAWCAADPGMREDLIAFTRTHLDAPPGLGGYRNDVAQLMAARASPVRPLEVSLPTLVLQGDADPIVSMEEARYLAASIPGAELEVYPGAGHAFFFTRRADTNARIRGFLAATSRR